MTNYQQWQQRPKKKNYYILQFCCFIYKHRNPLTNTKSQLLQRSLVLSTRKDYNVKLIFDHQKIETLIIFILCEDKHTKHDKDVFKSFFSHYNISTTYSMYLETQKIVQNRAGGMIFFKKRSTKSCKISTKKEDYKSKLWECKDLEHCEKNKEEEENRE